jgi:hypothetical protein
MKTCDYYIFLTWLPRAIGKKLTFVFSKVKKTDEPCRGNPGLVTLLGIWGMYLKIKIRRLSIKLNTKQKLLFFGILPVAALLFMAGMIFPALLDKLISRVMLQLLVTFPPEPNIFQPVPNELHWVSLPLVATVRLPKRLISNASIIQLPEGPIPDNAIHFLLTNKAAIGSPKARDLCAVEAAARVHPDKVVVMSVAADLLDNNMLIRGLSNAYANVAFIKLDVKKLLDDTVLRDWYKNSGVQGSKYFYVHDSDLARMAILQKYGGYYLDNDVLTIQRFANLHNSIALDHVDMFVNNNFLAFDKGHPFISDYMEYISET